MGKFRKFVAEVWLTCWVEEVLHFLGFPQRLQFLEYEVCRVVQGTRFKPKDHRRRDDAEACTQCYSPFCWEVQVLKGVTFKIQAPSLDGIVLAVVLVLVLVGVVGIVGIVMGCLIKGFRNHCSQARLISFSFLYNASGIHVGVSCRLVTPQMHRSL